MSWSLSVFRAGDVVEVRSQAEILATLDADGRFENLPFMPEMLQHCGKRLRVAAVAHKACDMIGKSGTARRLDRTVHLEGLRCDGSAHGGCQAECNLFWKDVWLKPVSAPAQLPVAAAHSAGCTEEQLLANTVFPTTDSATEVRYSCQGTRLFEATKPLPWWNVRQYVLDASTGNHPPMRIVRVLFLAVLRRIQAHVPFGYRLFKSFSDVVHRMVTGMDTPTMRGSVPDGQPTPAATLGLMPGERVRVKPEAQIVATLNSKGLNRGMLFDHEEMKPYCGKTFIVRKRVERIIEERTGRMLHMKQPCIMLEGVVCKALYAQNRLNCPRAIPSFWRELWLERLEDGK